MSSNNSTAEKQALVLSGGGARAAYQVGALKYIAEHMPDYRPQILTGVSAGAINAVYLASQRGSWRDSVNGLANLWMNLTTKRVYRTDYRSAAKRTLTFLLRVASGRRLGQSGVHGMVDNAPLRAFLGAHLPLSGQRILGIDENIRDGLLESLAIITTNYATGRTRAWIESANADSFTRSQLRAVNVDLALDHIMASAALPLFFPAVKLEGAWHGDGGIRLTAPLSPALHLGATRILAVSPRATPVNVMPEEMRAEYPSPAQIAGTLLNAVFLDLLDYDALQMNRVNRLLDRMDPEQWGDFRQVEVMVLRPRTDLGQLAREQKVSMPRAFRFFQRGVEDKDSKTSDALSMVMFEPEYLGLLLKLGEEDAAAQHDEIEAFLSGQACGVIPVRTPVNTPQP
ncbi:MAG: patatin-like phospholipase family protein [Pseudomonadota bacterium]